MKAISEKKWFLIIILWCMLFITSCNTLFDTIFDSNNATSNSSSNNLSTNQNLSQSQFNQLVDRYDLIYANATDHGERGVGTQDDVIIMISYARWLISSNRTIEHNLQRDMNSRIRTAQAQNISAGQVTSRNAAPIPWVGPTVSQIQAEYSERFRILNRQRLILEDINNNYTNTLIKEVGLSSNEIQNLAQPYIERLNRQLGIP